MEGRAGISLHRMDKKALWQEDQLVVRLDT